MLIERSVGRGRGAICTCVEIENICGAYSLHLLQLSTTIRARVPLVLDRCFVIGHRFRDTFGLSAKKLCNHEICSNLT